MSRRSAELSRLGYDRLRPLLFKLDPESAHAITLRLLQFFGSNSLGRNFLRALYQPSTPPTPVSTFGLQFSNPVGLAAGYDKNGIAAHGLACLGFGHLELGTVTLEPQSGQEIPRIFRLTEDHALINRMGFPNKGSGPLLRRLERRKPGATAIGVNIGKGVHTPLEEAASDYVALLALFYPVADYVTINISSPNTLGLRKLQSREYLQRLLDTIHKARAELEAQSGRMPILVKISPDLADEQLAHAVEAIVEAGMDGIIATNTTVQREGLLSGHKNEEGGLSGKPLRKRACEMVRNIHTMTSGSLPIVGVGGIFGGEDARAMLDSGASLVQIYTGLVYRGPSVVKDILRELGAS